MSPAGLFMFSQSVRYWTIHKFLCSATDLLTHRPLSPWRTQSQRPHSEAVWNTPPQLFNHRITTVVCWNCFGPLSVWCVWSGSREAHILSRLSLTGAAAANTNYFINRLLFFFLCKIREGFQKCVFIKMSFGLRKKWHLCVWLPVSVTQMQHVSVSVSWLYSTSYCIL